jgi:anaerobic dimethyl sulfoxide reductase subunit B (iron-sulfur subunit)
MYKCDGCAPRLQAGLAPACVAACGGKALVFGPIDELRRSYPKAVVQGEAWAGKVFGMPDGSKVKPSLVIIPMA